MQVLSKVIDMVVFDVLLTSANLMQSSIVFITLTANIPQWITINQKQSSENISLSSWVLWLLASFFAFFYALVNQVAYQSCLALVLSSSVSFLCNLYTIYLIFKYRAPHKAQVKHAAEKADGWFSAMLQTS